MPEKTDHSLPPRKWRNFAEKFTLEEFLKISAIQATSGVLDHWSYESIRLTSDSPYFWDRTGGCYSVDFLGMMDGQEVSYDTTICTTLFDFCWKALTSAWQKTALRYPNWCDFEWIDDDAVSKVYRFTSPYHQEAVKYCWDLLQQIADDVSYTVTERVEIKPKKRKGSVPGNPADVKDNPIRTKTGKYRMVIVMNGEGLPEGIGNQIVSLYSRGGVFNPDTTPQRYSFQAMQRYIVELNEHEMTLLNADGSIPKGTELDAELHKAVHHLDVGKIRHLLEMGANPNSVDILHNTALADAAETFLWDRMSYEEYQKLEAQGITDYPEEKRIEVYRLLLSWGADPNLFVYGGNLPLDTSVMGHRALETAFWLENGADPNINNYPDEFPDLVSSSLDTAYTEASYRRMEGDPEEVIKRCDTIVELLEKHGARLK